MLMPHHHFIAALNKENKGMERFSKRSLRGGGLIGCRFLLTGRLRGEESAG
jgi:hypothetical protein